MNISFSSQQQVNSPNLNFRSSNYSPKNNLINNRTSEKPNIANNNIIGTTLGGEQKKNNVLKNLMKQKEHLMTSRDEIMERGLKNGEDAKSIKDKLEEINQQIEAIDKQVNELQLKEQRKAMGAEYKNKKGSDAKEKSNNDSINTTKTDNSIDNLLNLSNKFISIKALSSQRNLMSGDARVLSSEIKIDKSRGLNPVMKKKQLAKIEDRVEDITEKLGNHLNDVNTEINNNVAGNSDELTIKQRNAQNINHYIHMDNYKINDNNEKINIIV